MQAFLDLYLRNAPEAALSCLFPVHDFVLDTRKDPFLAHFAYALAYGEPADAYFAMTRLYERKELLENPVFAQDRLCIDVSTLGTKELQTLFSTKTLAPSDRLHRYVSCLLGVFDQRHTPFEHACVLLHQAKPSLCKEIPKPFYPVTFSQELSLIFPASEKTPVLLLEPSSGPWEQQLGAWENVIFLFHNPATFWHCAAVKSLLPHLCKKTNLLLNLRDYPATQLLKQPAALKALANTPLQGPLGLTEALEELLKVPYTALKSNSHECDTFFRLGKALSAEVELKRLGKKSLIPLYSKERLSIWFSRYKSAYAHYTKQLELPLLDKVQKHIDELPKVARRAIGKPPYRIAHILPQLLDSNNGPQRIYSNMVTYATRSQFLPSVYCTESYIYGHGDFPGSTHTGQESTLRGKKRIAHLLDLNIPLYILPYQMPLERRAKILAELLTTHAIDVAIFHDADCVNLLCAQLCDVPIRVYHELGSLLPCGGFDLHLCGDLPNNAAMLEALGTTLRACPVFEELRSKWPKDPPLRADLELPNEAKLLCTASNHLLHRLTPVFCATVSEILLNISDAHYCLIGPPLPELLDRFHLAVRNRIHLLGTFPNSGHILRCMDLYLNEFPEGSGLSILDAMAAGVPVVSIYDPTASISGRSAGAYFGRDACVNDSQSYIQRACLLLKNPSEYASWKNYTLQRYEGFSKTENFVKNAEKHILDLIAAKTKICNGCIF